MRDQYISIRVNEAEKTAAVAAAAIRGRTLSEHVRRVVTRDAVRTLERARGGGRRAGREPDADPAERWVTSP